MQENIFPRVMTLAMVLHEVNWVGNIKLPPARYVVLVLLPKSDNRDVIIFFIVKFS